MRRFRISIGLVLIGLFLFASSSSGAEPPGDAPWKHFLTGDDAERITRIEKEMTAQYEAGRYAEALAPARQAFDIRRRIQGADHWQTVTARINVEVITKIASLPNEAQVRLSDARRLEANDLPELVRKARYSDAASLAEKIAAIRKRHLGENCSLVATALNSQAMNLYAAGQYRAAETIFRQAIEIINRMFGEQHPNLASACGNLGITLEALDKLEEAREAKDKALRIQLRAYGEKSESVAIAYNNVAHSDELLARYEHAAQGYSKSLAILTSLKDQRLEERIATAHGNLAGALSRQAKWAKAEREYQAALTMKRRIYGDDHPETALIYNNLGVCLADQEKYDRAEPLYRRALAIYNRALGEDHPQTLGTYNNLALVLSHRSKLVEAELLLRRALFLQSSRGHKPDHSTAIWLTNLAHVLEDEGRQADAIRPLREALEIDRQIFKDDHAQTALTAADLAVALTVQEKYGESEPLFRSAVESLRKSLGEKHPLTVRAQSNLGANLYDQGKFVEAESIHRKALAAFQELVGERHSNTAWAYKNLVIDLWVQGKYAEIETIAAAAAESFEYARRQAGLAGLERTAFVADNAALPILITASAARAGKAAQAWRFLENGLARGLLDDLTACRRTDAERESEQKLAGAVEKIDKQITALLNVAKVTGLARDEIQKLRRKREDAQRQLSEFEVSLGKKYAAAAGEIYELPRIQTALADDEALIAWVDFSAKTTGHDHIGEHWAFVIRRTGSPIWVSLAGSGDNGAWQPEDNNVVSKLRAQCVSRAGIQASTAHDLARKLYEQRIMPVEKQLSGIRRLVILPSPQLRGIPIEVLTEEIRPGRFIVSYAPSGTMFTWLREKRGHAVASRTGPENILAVGDPVFGVSNKPGGLPAPPEHGVLISAVTPNSNAARAGLKSGDVLLNYGVTKLNSAVDFKSAMANAPDSRETKSIPIKLWRDGETLEFNVAAGPLGATVSQSPAAEVIRAQRELDRLMRSSSMANFGRLKGAGREVQSVIGVFRTSKVLTGSEASEQNLNKLAAEKQLAQYRYLHFATHGLLDSQSPMRSALILSQDRLPDPLKQVLAGQQAYDGRLTAEQILRDWRLDADLVTLSACETGLGKYSEGEGYLGFSQALFLAGARTVVVSMWPVDDASTALLMTRFYENLLGRRPGVKGPMSKAQALGEAKRWLRGLTAEEAEQVGGGLIRGLDTDTARGRVRSRPAKQFGSTSPVHPYAHPYYWAPFILIGDSN